MAVYEFFESQDVEIAKMTLEVCYADGDCSECGIEVEPKQCSGAFLKTKTSKK